MKKYLTLMKKVISQGQFKNDRTGTGTISIFGYQMRFNLKKGFPLITTKLCKFSYIVHELLWFLKGQTNILELNKNKVSIWNHWADKNGNLGPIYGKQWRSWNTTDGKSIDQINKVIEQIKQEPNSRRMIVSAWNVGDLEKMALAPCHVLFQFYVLNNKISCQIYQRSSDIFIGLPFNIASYALLVFMIAQQCNLEVGELIWTGGDVHLYCNHIEQAKLQLSRKPLSLPKLVIKNKPLSIFDYCLNDFDLRGYMPYPYIMAPIAI
ncbi:MAG: thymidylate synthase [Candidatus Dasytiphilus stammeri]